MANLKSQYTDRIGWLAKLVTCAAISLGGLPTIVAQPIVVSTTPEVCEINLNLLKSDSQGDRARTSTVKEPQGIATDRQRKLLLKKKDISRVPPRDSNIITADTVSAKGMTLPSLWWTSEQFPAKLVKNWIADRNQKQVYLLINAQSWDLLDYIDRYRTIDQFGRVAQGYGYNLKLCNSQKIVLARYSCDQMLQDSCQIWLNATGQNGLGVQTK